MARTLVLVGLLLGFTVGFTDDLMAQGAPPSTTGSPTDAATETDVGWPREVAADNQTILVYQPQIEKWENNQIVARAAVSVTTAASSRPTFGVFWFTARTEVNKDTRLVDFEDFKVTTASFPTASDPDGLRQTVQKVLPQVSWTMALDHLQANLAMTQEELKTSPSVPLKNDPPRFLFSQTPAVLVLIDGKPVVRKVDGANLLRIINTRALILLDEQTGRYYLRDGDRWLQSQSLDGVWSAAQNYPAELEKIREALVNNGQADSIASSDDGSKTIPRVFVSTVPAELIQTQGAPQFAPIPATHLLYVQNTSADLFLDTSTQHHYVLVSGRWFRATSLDGPWEFVPGKSLPADFAHISDTHPKGDVLAAIPETSQAKEAVIENSIPQTASVKRSEAKLAVVYDGEPQFASIEGTPLQYVLNSPVPVIRVDASSYYSVKDGVWFVGTSPQGPWAVAAMVPAVLYTIPPSSPLHYVTYVKIYGATPEVVYVGYTPGYLGSCVSPEHVVVYGTGWVYRPYLGAFWVGFPVTYGFHAHYHWDWSIGWGWGFGWIPVYDPWWGPFGWGPGARHVAVRHVFPLYRPVNHVNFYHRWHENAVIRHVYPGGAGLRTHVPQHRSVIPWVAPKSPPNNVYAGHDGQVYRRGSKGWEQNQGNKWQALPRSSAGSTHSAQQGMPHVSSPRVPSQITSQPSHVAETSHHLEREHQAREAGTTRWIQHAQQHAQPKTVHSAHVSSSRHSKR